LAKTSARRNLKLIKEKTMEYIISGVIITIAGICSIIYGRDQNNTLVSQLSSLFDSGSKNPGTFYIILGVSGVIIGLCLIFYRCIETNVSTDKKNTFDKEKRIQFIGKNWRDVLLENNLGEYIETFEKNKLTDLNVIAELNESDLEKIGISAMGDRKNILKIFSTKVAEVHQSKLIKSYSKTYMVIKSTPLKLGSNILSETIKILEMGTKINFISENVTGWYYIEILDGEKGFCKSSDLNPFE
jgi:hypothetical protein